MTQRRRRRTSSRHSAPGGGPQTTKVRPLRPVSRLRVRSAEDFVELVPYLLGFHPVESLVVMLTRGGEVRLTARADLAGGAEPLRDVVRVATARCAADAMVLVAFSADPAAEEILAALAWDRTLPQVIEAVRVHERRWWSALSAGGCGELSQTGRVAAEAVFAGLSAAPTRAEAVAAAGPPPAGEVPRLLEEAERQAADLGVRSAKERADLAVSIVTAQLSRTTRTSDAATPWPEAERLRLAVLVDGDIAVRDAAWLMLTPENAHAAVRVWSGVVGCTPPGYDVAPLCLLGLAAWISGNGALLVECVERAGAADPRCSLVGLLARIVDGAVPPEEWSKVSARLCDRRPPAA